MEAIFLVCGAGGPQLKRNPLGCYDLMSNPTSAAWETDFFSLFGRRQAPVPCPGCTRRGLFGPRKAPDGRRYWLCKFCGRYQDIDSDPVQCLATVHGCPGWPTVAGAPYIWWVRPDEDKYTCPSCGTVVQTAAVVRKRPSEDPSHPWWNVPQELTFETAATFWHQHGEARVYL